MSNADATPFPNLSAKQPTIGKIVDDAMVAIERANTRASTPGA